MLLERTTTLSLNSAMKSSIRQLQVDLQNAQTELSTGRHSDVGLVLGSATGRNIDWRNEVANLQAALQRNGLLASRANVTQASLEGIKQQADKLQESIMGARSALNGGSLARTAGEHALKGVLDTLSTSYAGQFIFSGRSPDAAPLSGYDGLDPQAAFDAAFLAEFGFSKTSPLAANITPSQMQTFLSGRFEDLFKDPNWSADWSTADTENQRARIDGKILIEADANTNEMAFRNIIKAAVASYELGGTVIGQGTLQVVADSVMQNVGQGVKALGDIQARVGFSEQAIQQADARMTAKKSVLELSIGRTEGVSEYEAATRLNTLMTQLESSYAVTSKISKLSLLNYL